MSPLIKTVLIVAIIAGVGFVGYNYLSQDSSSGDLIVQVQDSDTSQVGAQVLSALNQLQQLRLDESVFTDKTFKSLKDFSRPLPTESVGRSNPFAPIGVEAPSSSVVVPPVSSTTTAATSTQAKTPSQTQPKAPASVGNN